MSTSTESGHQGRTAGHMMDGHHLIDGSFPNMAHEGHHTVTTTLGKSKTNGPNTMTYSHSGSLSAGQMSKGDRHESVYSGGGQV